jgi:hypothetical protein
MAAIFKLKMAADRGRILSGTCPEMNQYPKKYICAKFGAFIPICTIFPLSAGLRPDKLTMWSPLLFSDLTFNPYQSHYNK